MNTGAYILFFDSMIIVSICKTASIIGERQLNLRFGFKEEEASIIIMVPYLICVVMGPLIGYLLDKNYVKRVLYMYV
jgi:hypothetical protein